MLARVHDIFLSRVALFGTVSRGQPYMIGIMSTPQHVSIRWSEIESDPGRLVREMEAGKVVKVTQIGGAINYTVAPTTSVVMAPSKATLGGEFVAIGVAPVVLEFQQIIEQVLAQLPSSGLVPVEDIKQILEESFDDAEAEDMVSLPSRRTGVGNTIFISSGNPRHAPRIKIAVDPPDSFNPRAKNVTMQLHGDNAIDGDKMPPRRVIKQAKRWIKQNFAVLMQHWDNEISGDEVVKRVVPLPGTRTKRSPRAASKKRSQKPRSR
jgi:hypothetical protein